MKYFFLIITENSFEQEQPPQILVVVLPCVFVFVLIISIAAFVLRKHSRGRYPFRRRSASEAMSSLLEPTSSIPLQNLSWIPSSNILAVDPEWEVSSDNLVTLDLLGEGQFGVVHRGTLTRQKNTYIL